MICPNCQSRAMRKLSDIQVQPTRPPSVFSQILLVILTLFLMLVMSMFISLAFPKKDIYLVLIFCTLGIPAFFLNLLEYRQRAALRAKYPQRLKEWNGSWRCMTCGQISLME